MKKAKIAACVLLTAAMVLSLAACGTNEQKPGNGNEAETSDEVQTSETSDESEASDGEKTPNESETSNGEEKENEMEQIELDTGGVSIQVDHHNRTIHGEAYLPDNVDSFPIVVFSHGYNGYKTDFADTAVYLMDNGVASLTFTFCGSGDRDPSGFGTTNMTLFTEKEDLSAMMDYAKRIKGFNGSLYLFGGSQGGMVSAMTAEERQADIKGMVLIFPAFSIPDNWNNANYPVSKYPTEESIPEVIDFWGVKLGRGFVYTLRDLDIFTNMADFTKPVLILHGTKDDVVPLSYSERAVNTYPNADLVIYEGEGHGFTPKTMRDVEKRLFAFLNDNP